MATKILIAEDNKLIREHIKEELEERGFIVSDAKNGESCLNQIKKSIPDILILDIMMDGITGIGVLRKIRTTKRTQHIYIIANTIVTQNSREGRIIQSFTDDYIVKPAGIDVLLSAVEKGVKHIDSQS